MVPKRILMLGATGTIGRATLQALVRRGYQVVCFARPGSEIELSDNVEVRFCEVTDITSLARSGFCGEKFDAVLSCMASRSGRARDAWMIDHDAHVKVLDLARSSGVRHFILLSAICVQKPLLQFQQAKLAFEKALIESGMTYSIVRPTAFFKSLSGQVERVKRGKPFVMFGDGNLTACKPISDDDLAEHLSNCIDDVGMHNRILPIGGPGEAMTPLQQGQMLFALLGQAPRFKYLPVRLLDLVIAGLNVVGHIVPAAARKAELARIGRYYATESMLVINPDTGEYDPDATPSTGTETLADHYRRLISGKTVSQRGEHSVF